MGKNTIAIDMRLDVKAKSLKNLAKDADGLRKVLKATVKEAHVLRADTINFAALASGVNACQRSFGQLRDSLRTLGNEYASWAVSEQKLSGIMRQRMGATSADIQQIADLVQAQQGLGVISNDVQLAGAQSVATFLDEKESIATLLPAMNDLIAHQKGIYSTSTDAESIGRLMGKAMKGQTSALARLGVGFTDAEEHIMRFGSESERSAVIADAVTRTVGHMNANLAKTDSGKQKQWADRIADTRAELGKLTNQIYPFVSAAAQISTVGGSLITVFFGTKRLTRAVWRSTKAFTKSIWCFVTGGVKMKLYNLIQKTVIISTKLWTAAQTALNWVLKKCPIVWLISILASLIGSVVLLYKKNEKFRHSVQKLWSWMKKLGSAIINFVVKSFKWALEAGGKLLELIKKFLHLDKKTAKIEVDVEPVPAKSAAVPVKGPGLIEGLEAKIGDARRRLTEATSDAAIVAINKEISEYERQLDRYRSLGVKVSEAVGEGVRDGATWASDAATLHDIEQNIKILRDRLQLATLEEAAGLNQQISGWEAKAEAIRNAGIATEDFKRAVWVSDASTLKEIENNIQILNDRLQTATLAESESINRQIAGWTAKAAEFRQASWVSDASTLADIGRNLQILRDRLQTADIVEAESLNRQIAGWEAKAEAIRNAGKEAEKQSLSTGAALGREWEALKGIGGSVEGITSSLRDNGNAWRMVTGVVDGFISLIKGMREFVGVLRLLTGATDRQATAERRRAGATLAASAADTASTATEVANSATKTAASGREAAADATGAAAKIFKAHSWMPFVGVATAAALVAVMIKALSDAKSSVPKFAAGGIAFGPTLGLFGEYPGARTNPEVVAPLDKLRGLLVPATGGGPSGSVEFKIDGRQLVGVLNREQSFRRRS